MPFNPIHLEAKEGKAGIVRVGRDRVAEQEQVSISIPRRFRRGKQVQRRRREQGCIVDPGNASLEPVSCTLAIFRSGAGNQQCFKVQFAQRSIGQNHDRRVAAG